MGTAPDTTLAPQLPDTLRLGAVQLTVSSLDDSIAFYARAVGLQLRDREDDSAAMGAGGEDLVVLHEEPGAAPGGRHAGLFHFALLFPSREELARAVLRLGSTRTRIEGASDHGVSEAIYLRDPDYNGIELYSDRPREQWPPGRTADERFELFTIALDMTSLMSTTQVEETRAPAGPGLQMGHVHLHVGDVQRGLDFYHDILGFDVIVKLGSAAFVSAGGYHHHLGFNVWLGSDVKPLPPKTAGLRNWTVVLDDAGQVEQVRARVERAGLEIEQHASGFLVRDAWGTAVIFRPAPPVA